MGVYQSDEGWEQRRKLVPALLFIVLMSPPGYPSAWLPPGRARFRFTWRSHCSPIPHGSSRLLAAKLTLLPRRFQFAIPGGVDLRLPPG